MHDSPSSSSDLDRLEARLVASWRSGRRDSVESLLAELGNPPLPPDQLWRLLSREIALAREAGTVLSSRDYERRFPQFRSDLAKTFANAGPGDVTQSYAPPESDTATLIGGASPPAANREPPSGSTRTRTRESGDATRSFAPSQSDAATIVGGDPANGGREHPYAPDRPREFGDYEILGEIARGGMGVVYRARQKGLNRTVALKMILAGQLASESNIRRFYAEAEAAAGLDHSGIVPIYEVGQRGSQHFFSMAYVDGQSLHDRLKKGPLPPREAAALLSHVADAVQFAHARGIVHRDLKPQNILLDASGHPKVTDFGLAKRMEGGEGLTQSGDILGTPSYMAPEQAEGKIQEQGPLVDVYALGAVLYAALTGRPPFQAPSLMEILRLVVHQEPVAPRLLNAAIPQDLDTICLKSLHKDPRRRYGSAGELREDLVRFLEGRPISARPVGGLERLARWCRRNPVVASLVGLLATVLTAAAVISSTVAVQMKNLAESEKDANQQAQRNSIRERDARLEAQEAEKQATAAKGEAVAARLVAERRLAESYLDTGRELCDQGQIPAGLLWMTRGLKLLPADSEVLEGTIRANLGAWFPRMHTVERSIPQPAQSRAALFHPDGKRFATGGMDGFVRIFRVDGTLVATSETPHEVFIRRIAFSPDGTQIASCADDRTVRFWDVETGREATPPIRAEHAVTCIAYHPSGKTILVGTESQQKGGVRFWDIAALQPTGPTFDTKGGIFALALSRSGKWIVTGGIRAGHARGSGWAQVWDAETGAVVGGELRQRFRIVAVDISPDETHVATGSWDATARLWDRQTSQPTSPLMKHLGTCQEVRFSPDGRQLLSTARDRGYLWDAATGESRGQLVVSPGDTYGAAFRPDGRQILLAGVEPATWIWNLAEDLDGLVFPDKKEAAASASGLGFSPDGRWGISDGYVFDTATRREAGPLIPNGPEYNAQFSPDGTRFVTGSRSGRTQVFSLEPRQPVGKPLQHGGLIVAAVFSPDGERVGTSSHDNTARLWSAETGEPIGAVMSHPTRVWGAAFQPHGDLFATICEDNRIRFWNGRTGERSGPPIEIADRGYDLAFSPDGRRLATGSFENLVRFWDVETRREIRAPLQHASPVNRVVFSADGRFLATGCFDSGVRLWNLQDGRRIGPVGWHDGQVIGLALRGDASMLLAGTEHAHARIQNLPGPLTAPADDIERTINIASRQELTPENVLRPIDLSQWTTRKSTAEVR